MNRSLAHCVAFALILNFGSLLDSVSGDDVDRPILVCSTTQVADFARQVVGDDWDVRCLLAPGQDPHLYRVTPNDAKLVADATLCLSNGLNLEGNNWMGALAQDAGKPLVECTEGIRLLKVPADEGDAAEEVADPHAWFSPQNAAVYVRNILRGVKAIDPDGSERYESRAALYLSQLRGLDAWIKRQCNAIPRDRRVLVTSHDAFGYFCADYGFRSAAPAGWSTGQEIGAGITPARRKAAVDSIREFGVKAIFVETSVNPKLIREIASEAGVQIGGELYSDSMGQAGTAGESYLGMMRENVLTLVNALR